MASMKAITRRTYGTLGLPIAMFVSGACAMSNRDVAENNAEINGGGGVTIIGRLTSEGVECQALRGDDGQLYTLLGDLGKLSVETRVRVSGERLEFSTCQQGITIRIQSIAPADPDSNN
jgi:hypothetical protein